MENRKKPRGRTTNITRSRGGCLACKRLRIKCDQTKPQCEYCKHRGRECSYSLNLVSVSFKQPYHSSKERTLIKYQSNLTNQFKLNNATSQLGISKFELRLLCFFNDYCVEDIMNGVNDAIHDIWSIRVPSLFLESELIRNSIYSYASLNMYPFCDDIQTLQIQDNAESQIKVRERINSIPFLTEIDSEDPYEMRINTARYFSNTLLCKYKLLSKLQNGEAILKGNDQAHQKMLIATEFSVSCMLILLFLSIHSHRILPLVCFDKSESDFVSICKGMRETIMIFQASFRYNAFKDAFKRYADSKVPPVKESEFPILIALRQDLELAYEDREFSLTRNEEYLALYDGLEHLQASVGKAMVYGHALPLIRWLSVLSNKCVELIYSQNSFALRLLYVYSSLSTLTKFQMYKDANIWLDFMNWYKQYNLELFGDWKYGMDKSLYFLALQKDFKFIEGKYANLQSFDPEYFEQVVFDTLVDDIVA
ncbi:hypothetical protein DFJ63DRAFT_139469 [Scheffersomyces coipomensis]|uniref:uncharacterized protein n=1 Tax=Scheffersomyces coipomensis TaxID=1788519 RepID=UPI00315CE735